MNENTDLHTLEKEIAELRWQLDEANETIEAIRTGQVDGLIVKEPSGNQLYTLKSADQTYRLFIEKMTEGAVTLNQEGLIVYSNSRFASMLNFPLSEVIGVEFKSFVTAEDKETFSLLIQQGWQSECKGEACLVNKTKEDLPFLISLTTLELDEGTSLSIIVTDLSVQKKNEKQLRLKNEQLQQAHHSLAQLYNELEDRVKERTHELSLSRQRFNL